MGEKEFDAVVIGSGPGGYVCAIRCSQLGMKTALVEKYENLGGTCLNVGCIPSKAWLDSSEKYFDLIHRFGEHGISCVDAVLDFGKMRKRVEKVVSQTSGGINFLMKKNKIDVFHGMGSFKGAHSVEVRSAKGSILITGKNIVIATGSKPSSLPGVVIDKKKIVTSTEALYLDSLPGSLVVVGGGVIGCELAGLFRRLGTKVDIVEYADSLIASMDEELGKALGRIFKKEGIGVNTKCSVETIEAAGPKVVVKAGRAEGSLELEADLCLMAVGRRPYTDGLGLENVGIETDPQGRVVTDARLRTKQHHIYAIGDAVAGPMLAHKAEEEGVFVAESIAGGRPHINYDLIPGVVYTWPEVAGVGFDERRLKAEGTPYRVGSFPFRASGRAGASGEAEGFVKVLAHAESDEILGVHMIGPRCADMVAEAVVAMEFRASAEDVARICHAHPTYSEAFKEACLAACGSGSIHT